MRSLTSSERRRIPIVFPISYYPPLLFLLCRVFLPKAGTAPHPPPSVGTSTSLLSSSFPPRMTNVPFFFLRRIWLRLRERRGCCCCRILCANVRSVLGIVVVAAGARSSSV